MVTTVSRLMLFILIDNILNFYSYSCCRYSNRVKAETDRIDRLEFDDLEVTLFLSFWYSMDPWNYIIFSCNWSLTLCRWMKRKYTFGSLKLDFILFRFVFAVIVNLCDFTMDIAKCRIRDFNFALEPVILKLCFEDENFLSPLPLDQVTWDGCGKGRVPRFKSSYKQIMEKLNTIILNNVGLSSYGHILGYLGRAK